MYFENVGAVHRQQDLVHLEDVLGFERNRFEPPGIGADRDHALAGEIFGAFDAEAGFAGVKALVVLADQAGPAGMEQHDVALADFDALLLGDLLDLLDVEGGAFLDDVGAVMGGHVEQHAARHHRRDFFDAEFLQSGRIGEIGELVAVVVDVVDAEMAETVELAADADPASMMSSLYVVLLGPRPEMPAWPGCTTVILKARGG